jgi:hypothetical protein
VGPRPPLTLCSYTDLTHVHVPTISGNLKSLHLIIIIFSLSSFALLDLTHLSFTLDDITLTTWPISTPYLLVMNHIEHLSKRSMMICFSTYSITVTQFLSMTMSLMTASFRGGNGTVKAASGGTAGTGSYRSAESGDSCHCVGISPPSLPCLLIWHAYNRHLSTFTALTSCH